MVECLGVAFFSLPRKNYLFTSVEQLGQSVIYLSTGLSDLFVSVCQREALKLVMCFYSKKVVLE